MIGLEFLSNTSFFKKNVYYDKKKIGRAFQVILSVKAYLNMHLNIYLLSHIELK